MKSSKVHLSAPTVKQLPLPDKGRHRYWDDEIAGFCLIASYTGKRTWYLRYRSGGAQRLLKLGTYPALPAPGAKEVARHQLKQIAKGKDPQGQRETERQDPTIRELVKQFRTQDLETRNLRPKTLREYRDLLDLLADKLGGRKVSQVTRADVEGIHRSMRDQPYAANKWLVVISQVFAYAQRLGMIDKNPAAIRNNHTPDGIQRFKEARRIHTAGVMRPDQIKALHTTLDDLEQKWPLRVEAIRMAAATGWRIGEVLSLEWDRVDLAGGVAELIRTKTSDSEIRILGDAAVEILTRMRAHRIVGNPYVFPKGRTHLDYDRVFAAFARARCAADLGGYRIHDLRHLMVTNLISNGTDIRLTGSIVGHKDIASTKIYSSPTLEAQREALNRTTEKLDEVLNGD